MTTQAAICKSCNTCRASKVKCDGSRPRCETCVSRQSNCVYPLDGRFRRMGSSVGRQQQRSSVTANLRGTNANHHSEHALTPPLAPPEPDLHDTTWKPSFQDGLHTPLTTNNGDSQARMVLDDCSETHKCYHPLYDALGFRSAPPQKEGPRKAADIEASRSRLIANSALLRQREKLILRAQPSSCSADFDGVEPVLAIHLFELYWNTVHLTWHLTYRPAIMDSLFNGGPYMNKLLLNAIYLSSSTYSNRNEVRGDAVGTTMSGESFYSRFCQLLPNEMEHPSVPTATALLLCGTSLICLDKSRTGRMFCDIGIGMVRNLDCHRVVGGDKNPLLSDVDIEVRKRLYLGTFCIDAFLALYIGRKPTFDIEELDDISADPVLDTYEELENWSPYNDQTATGELGLGTYRPHPSYALSAFQALVDLLKIYHDIIDTFHGDAKRQLTMLVAQQAIMDFDRRLASWHEVLPPLVQDDNQSHSISPPHLLDLLLLYYAVKILLRKPVLEQPHLSQHLRGQRRLFIEGECQQEVMAIQDLIEIYRSAFSLQRASLIASFGVYLALATLLEDSSPSSISSRARSLLSALHEIADGSNSGLHKVIARMDSQVNALREGAGLDTNQMEANRSIVTPDIPTNHRHDTRLSVGMRFSENNPAPTNHIRTHQEPTSTAVHDSNSYITRLVDLCSLDIAACSSRSWIRGAAELSREDPLLQNALEAIGRLLIGKLEDDMDTEHSGELAYIRVLQGVNEVISNDKDSVSIELLLTLVLLATAELFRKKSESSVSYHWKAALALFERKGPLCYTSGIEHTLYTQLRPMCVMWALTVRASTFLSKKEWKELPWMGDGQKDILQHLLDVVLDIPSFLEQLDTMKSLDGQQAARKETQGDLLATWALSLRDALDQWKSTYIDTYEDRQPQEVPQSPDFPKFQHRTNERILSTPTVWLFPNPVLAASICTYNASHLILMETGFLPIPSGETQRYRYAWDICRSVQYYVYHTPWTWLLHVELPLRVAYRVLPEDSLERGFIKDVCGIIRRNSKLEIFSSVEEGQHLGSTVPFEGTSE